MSVGYRYNAIDIGNTFYDTCIKIVNTPPKCSWKSGIGLIDDIEATHSGCEYGEFDK